jgi:endonuclease YncB( thermonuclease family)
MISFCTGTSICSLYVLIFLPNVKCWRSREKPCAAAGFGNHIFKNSSHCLAQETDMAKTTNRRRKRTGGKRAAPASGGGMAPWYVLAATVIAGIVYMDNRAAGPEPASTAIRTASIERESRKVEREAVLPRPKQKPAAERVEEKLPAFSGKWFICTTQTDYCVLDGATILYAGRKVRLADIDAPAIAEARCDAERLRGGDAKLRLREILNEGDVTLVASGSGGRGKAGAAPHLVLRNGKSVGHRLVSEGFAKPWTGRHQSWCG